MFKTAGENIAYVAATGREIVVSLLVGDGVSSRGHRRRWSRIIDDVLYFWDQLFLLVLG